MTHQMRAFVTALLALLAPLALTPLALAADDPVKDAQGALANAYNRLYDAYAKNPDHDAATFDRLSKQIVGPAERQLSSAISKSVEKSRDQLHQMQKTGKVAVAEKASGTKRAPASFQMQPADAVRPDDSDSSASSSRSEDALDASGIAPEVEFQPAHPASK